MVGSGGYKNMDKKIKSNSSIKYSKAKNNGIFGSCALFDIVNSPEWTNFFQRATSYMGRSPDMELTKLIEEKGFNALPILVDKDKFNLLIRSRLTHIYRGVCYKNALKDFLYNKKMFVGKGIFCNGIYFAYGIYAKNEAMVYMSSQAKSDEKIIKKNGTILEALVSQDANIIDMFDLNCLRQKLIDDSDKLTNLSDMAKDKLIRLLSDDIAKSAVLLGYDGIDIKIQEYLAMLNRGKLIMEKPIDKEK